MKNLPNKEPSPSARKEIARIFHALGDPTRRKLVEKIGEGPVSVSKLAEPLAISLAAVVQHMQLLEEAGLVRTEKLGRVRTCRLDPAGLDAIEDWVRNRRSPLEVSLNRLADLLSEPEQPS